PTLIGCIFLKNKAPNSSEAAPALPKRGAHSTEFYKNCNYSFAPFSSPRCLRFVEKGALYRPRLSGQGFLQDLLQ
ncbi:MAG: hypothetical protein PHG47_10585, partial [Sulfuricella sp.]|nr:hypothetical protein [Sulfuricella sp.]